MAQPDKELAAELRAFMKESGMSGAALAKAMGWSPSAISHWMKDGVSQKNAKKVSVRLSELRSAITPPINKEDEDEEEVRPPAETVVLPEIPRLALSDEPSPGFVYVHTGTSAGNFKVGRTNDLLERIPRAKQIYKDLRLVLAVPTHDQVALERLVHEALAEFRGEESELFTASQRKVVDTVLLYQMAVARFA
jgi:transcriptional regulator with XRE-family HTH domain